MYAKRYLQLSSLVYDLKGYFVYLDKSFAETLENELDQTGKYPPP